MTILWIPHSPFEPGAVRRDQHLIRHLREKHRILSVTWETRGIGAFWKGLQRYSFSLPDGRTAYHVRRIPDPTRKLRNNGRKAFRLNEWFFRNDIRAIIEKEGVDVVVTAYSSFMTGYPPFDVDVPIIFDYLDCSEWSSETPDEKPYITHADRVLCVSALAEEQAQQFNPHTVFLPNGADVERLRAASGKSVRERYGLRDATVASIIGLGACGSHYFIEAILQAREHVPDLTCLLVGQSDEVKQDIEQLPPHAQDAFIYVGPVPYEEVASFFAASDVGMYPVDGTSYDDGRSPIKIFEYTALGIPVVVPRLREVKRTGFENIVHARPAASYFADGIVEAANRGDVSDPSVEQYDWKQLAEQLDETLREVSYVVSPEFN